MLNDFKCSCPVYIACGHTDLRGGIDGLTGLVSIQFQDGSVPDGVVSVLRQKARPQQGAVLGGRRISFAVQTTQQCHRLMEALNTEQPKANKTVTGLGPISCRKTLPRKCEIPAAGR